MNISQLNKVMEKLKGDIGDALITSSIIGFSDGQTILIMNPIQKPMHCLQE